MSLKEWRKAAGLTQRELANLARVARSSVSHVENGHYPPTPGFAGKVCRALSDVFSVTVNTWDVFPDSFYIISTRLAQPHRRLPACEPAGNGRVMLKGALR